MTSRKTSLKSSSISKVTPAHWPADVQYIAQLQYHTSVSKETLPYLRHGTGSPKSTTVTTPLQSSVAIRPIVEVGHPAKGQRGLFATKKIPPHTHLLDYLGEVHCDDRPDSDYDISLYRTAEGVSVGVDARTMGNAARFINDFRGVKPKPNALFEERRTTNGELRMSVWSGSSVIRKGEELLVSYGKGFWRARLSDTNEPEASLQEIT